MIKFTRFLTIVLLFVSSHAFAQPANDDICGAISLTVSPGSTCTSPLEFQSTQFATQSLPPCIGSSDDDVWYSFVATSTSHYIRISDYISPGSTDRVHQVYSSSNNSCSGTLTSLTCSDPEYSLTSGLIIGNTYFVRVHSEEFGFFANYHICVITPPPPPVNNECSNAVTLSPQAYVLSGCPGSVQGSTISATQSILPGNSNWPFSIDDDVWYSFTATQSSHIIRFCNVSYPFGSSGPMHIELYPTCTGTPISGSGKSVSIIFDRGEVTFSSLIIGTTYKLRVMTSSTSSRANFDISILNPLPPPTNDNICNAISLNVSPQANCTSLLSAQTTQFASQSLPACTGTADDDIWFSFVATSTSHIITLSDVVSNNNRVHQVYETSDNTCTGTLTSLTCSDPDISTTTGLKVGNTYFVRVYSWNSGVIATFNICVTTPTPPPINDDICNSLNLSISSGITCTSLLSPQSTLSATLSLPACDGIADDDIWYSFVAISSTHTITLSNVTVVGSSNERVHEVYESSDNTCTGTLTSLTCSDREVSSTSGLRIGNTYFVRVHTQGSGTFSNFGICITTPPPPPSNDECSGAITLLPQPNTLGCPSPTAGTTINALKSNSPSSSGWFSGADDDIWYSFTTGGNITSQIIRFCGVTYPTGSMVNMGFELHENCSTSGIAYDAASIFNGSGGVTLNGLTANTNYKLRVLTVGTTSRANFNISILNPPANSTFENEVLSNVSIFPSPTEDKVAIQFSSEISGEAEMKIFDFLGRVVKNQTFSAMVGSNNSELSLGELPSGTYFVQVKIDSQSTKPVRVIKL
jgi:large repetitive protein